MITVAIEDPAQPEIIHMLEAGEAHSASLYPAESNHHLPLDALRAPEVLFHVARDPHGRALGTGAIVLKGADGGDSWAELKRMWTDPAARGQGVAAAMLAALEAAARAHGVRVLRLETGNVSHAALGLYRRFGYAEIAAFDGYAPDPLSVFMEKRLPA